MTKVHEMVQQNPCSLEVEDWFLKSCSLDTCRHVQHHHPTHEFPRPFVFKSVEGDRGHYAKMRSQIMSGRQVEPPQLTLRTDNRNHVKSWCEVMYAGFRPVHVLRSELLRC